MKGNFWMLWITALAFVSCSTLQEDLIEQENQEQPQDMALLYQWEEQLLSAESVDLAALRKEMESTPLSLNRQYQASVYALQAWAAELTGEHRLARNYLDEARAQDGRQEWVLYVEALLMDDSREALDFMDSLDEELPRIKVYQALLLYQNGNYGEALVCFDDAFSKLPENFRQLYQPLRDRCWEFRDQQVQSSVAALLSDEPIDMETMMNVTLEETILLDRLSGENKISRDKLFSLLTEMRFFIQGSLKGRHVRRIEAAVFLWHLLMEKEDKPQWEFQYREYFDETPIADVPLDHPGFDAVLGCVEKEIMNLPDGQNFNPHLVVTGWDFLDMLKRVENY